MRVLPSSISLASSLVIPLLLLEVASGQLLLPVLIVLLFFEAMLLIELRLASVILEALSVIFNFSGIMVLLPGVRSLLVMLIPGMRLSVLLFIQLLPLLLLLLLLPHVVLIFFSFDVSVLNVYLLRELQEN